MKRSDLFTSNTVHLQTRRQPQNHTCLKLTACHLSARSPCFGAGGTNIGYHLIRAFLADGTFQVTVLARSASTTSYPPAVKLVKISDFGDHEELVQALKGQDVLISCVGPGAFAVQNDLVDACLRAGVTRFIPTEWGFDNDDSACRGLCPPVFGAKGKFVDDVLRPKESELEWTAVASSIWLDWSAFPRPREVSDENSIR